MIFLNDSVKDSTTMVSIMCASFSKTNFFKGFREGGLFERWGYGGSVLAERGIYSRPIKRLPFDF